MDRKFPISLCILLQLFLLSQLISSKDHSGKHKKLEGEELDTILHEYVGGNKKLYEHLFGYYHKELSPIYVQSHQHSEEEHFKVPSFKINFTLMNARLLDIDEAGQVFSMIVELNVVWQDIRLRWNPANYSGIDNIVVPSAAIWVPDFVFYDQVTESINLIPDPMRYVRINHNGILSFPSASLVRSVCILDIREFPFDIQHCTISLGTFIYLAKEIAYKIIIPEFTNTTSMTYGWHGNGEWQVNNVSAKRIKESNEFVKFEYISISFELQRHPSFFVAVIIMPCFLLNVLCVLGMFVERSEETLNKMILGLTSLMAMSVELGIIAEEMPKTETLPLLADFVIVCILIIALASMVVVILPKIHILSADGKHPVIVSLGFPDQSRLFL